MTEGGLLVATGGLQGDEPGLVSYEKIRQRIDSLRAAGNLPGLAALAEGEIEVVIGEVDTDEEPYWNGHCETSLCVPRMPALVRYGLRSPKNCSG